MKAPIIRAMALVLVLSIPSIGLPGDAEVSDVILKWMAKPGGASAFRAKIRVTNPTDRDLRVYGWLILYDGDGFQVARVPFLGGVKAGSTATLATRGFLSARDRADIARHEASIEREYPMGR